jgi:hypothetical protein
VSKSVVGEILGSRSRSRHGAALLKDKASKTVQTGTSGFSTPRDVVTRGSLRCGLACSGHKLVVVKSKEAISEDGERCKKFDVQFVCQEIRDMAGRHLRKSQQTGPVRGRTDRPVFF